MGMTYRGKLESLIKLHLESADICYKQSKNYKEQGDCYIAIAESYEAELAILEGDDEP